MTTRSEGRTNLIASELTLDDFLNISDNSGEKLKELNLIVNSTNAWGLLRKDLITALGIQRAKRFLLRYGYHCGVEEARIFKDAFQWKTEIEWMIAGTKAHDLFGRVFSYPDTFHVDIEQGIFDVSGYWIDSYEAKQHLQNFSEHNEAVCYYLVGYASGYNSECLGKKVIFREEKCRGKGDDHCSYVGKTVEQWGEDIAEELLYFEDEDMSHELDQMYRKVEQQKEGLKMGYAISQELTQAMLQGQGFETFAKILGQKLHCQVLIQDKGFKELARFGGSPDLEKIMDAKQLWDKESEQDLSKTIKEVTLPNRTFKLLTTTFKLKKQVYGYITITFSQRVDAFLKDILQRVTTIASLHIHNERVAIETEQRLKGELLEQLLNEKDKDKDKDKEDLKNRFSYLGYNLAEPHYVMQIEIEHQGQNAGKEYRNSNYLKARNSLINILTQIDVNILAVTKVNTIQVILKKQLIDNQQTTIKKFGENLLKRVAVEKQRIYIGISKETEITSDFYKKALEAKKALDFAKIQSAQSRVVLSSELGYALLFLNAKEPEELLEFANENVKAILAYDQKKKSELLQTLFYYAQNEFNLHKTAREMSISISGMRYRIQKIEELLKLNLSNSNARFDIQVSLQILLVIGKITI